MKNCEFMLSVFRWKMDKKIEGDIFISENNFALSGSGMLFKMMLLHKNMENFIDMLNST